MHAEKLDPLIINNVFIFSKNCFVESVPTAYLFLLCYGSFKIMYKSYTLKLKMESVIGALIRMAF
jgi:hypothetical protein